MIRRLRLAALLTVGLAGAAGAADLPTRKAPAPVPPPPVYSWTGSFIGVAGGYAFGSAQVNHGALPAPVAETNPFDINGGVFGITSGYNYQIGQAVIGYEGDFSWTSIKGTGGDIAPFNPAFSQTAKEDWLMTTRARLGYAWNNVLLYGTGGAAETMNHQLVQSPAASIEQGHLQWGWAAGAGVEWMLYPNVSVKAEYLHVGINPKSYFQPGTAVFLTAQQLRYSEDIIRVGLNYHFDLLGMISPAFAKN